MHYFIQTVEQIQVNKKETEIYLKSVIEYFSEELKSIHEIENEGKKNLFIEALVANEGVIMDNKPTFE